VCLRTVHELVRTLGCFVVHKESLLPVGYTGSQRLRYYMRPLVLRMDFDVGKRMMGDMMFAMGMVDMDMCFVSCFDLIA
jgi:hypothetical protein